MGLENTIGLSVGKLRHFFTVPEQVRDMACGEKSSSFNRVHAAGSVAWGSTLPDVANRARAAHDEE
ncbi:MAG: hypothetical protein R3C68_17350 [Myxococcota bacterium]